MALAARVYRRLLRLYPARFREEYGTPLEHEFADEYRDAGRGWRRAVFWAGLAADLLVSIPRERARELVRDARYAVRVYARRPLVTLLAFAALTLAIGATTGVFSVVNALLLRPLPFRAPDRIVRVEGYRPPGTVTAAGFHQWRRQSTWLEDASIYDRADMTLARNPGAVRVAVCETSANFFAMLGVRPAFGRAFSDGEDTPGRNGVAVISDRLWQQAFAADPRVMGTTVRVNGAPVTIVGIAPRQFDYPAGTAMWTPTVFEFERLPKGDVTFFQVFGRLKAGMTPATGTPPFEAEVARTMPEALKPPVIGDYGRVRPRLVSIRDELAGPARRSSLVLFGAVAFVLLVACANVANLLLTRATERRTELAIRTALGASRARLLQQLVTESLMLTLTAAACGLLVARWAAQVATAVQPAQLAVQAYAVLDRTVLGFAVGIAVLTAVLFGVAPAVVITRPQRQADAIRARTAGSGESARLRGGLIAIQTGLTLVLVAGGLTMARAFVTLVRADLGFRAPGVVTAAVSLTGTPYETREGASQYYRRALERLRAVAGVESAAAVDALPLAIKGLGGTGFGIEGGGQVRLAMVVGASPSYFRTIGAAVLHGREFAETDAAAAEPVAVVNEEFARSSGYGGAIVGKVIAPEWGGKRQGRARRVIGVTRGLRDGGPGYRTTEEVFVPIEQRPPGTAMLLARVGGDAAKKLAVCRDALQSVDHSVGVFDVKTLDDRLAGVLAAPRFYTTVALFFAGFALLLAVVGVYGVTSHSVVQRTHEIGVRMALGGHASAVRALLGRQTLAAVAAGMLLGVGGTLALGRLLGHLIASARAIEPVACVAGAGVVALAAAAAVWTATRRILRLDPVHVLRSE